MDVLKTADLCDTYSSDLQVCMVQFQMFGGSKSFSGEIETVSTFEDVGLIKYCLEQPGRGRVLVVDGGGSLRVALLGDRLCSHAVQNGWRGVIIFGAVRDSEELLAMNIGVMALGVSPKRGTFDNTGAIGVGINFGDVEFLPGYFVYCDLDGLVVSQQCVQVA